MATAEPRYFAGDAVREFRVFVAIDLGTTYSACSFALGKTSSVINCASEKIPTALLLDSSLRLDAFGSEAMEKYFDMEDDEREEWYYFDRFKMELHNEEHIQPDMRLSSIDGKQLPAKIVFGRSLQFFKDLAIKLISEKSLAGCFEEEVKWTLTVPAIWGDRAKEFMKKAAEEASMDTDAVELALEPEGAAFRCRDDLYHVHDSIGKPPTLRYVVADCGGGTIDLTVHDLAVSTKKINEVHRATGGDWGGTTVDAEMLKLVRRVIGEDVASRIKDMDWLRFSRESIEEAKRKAGTTSNDKIPIVMTREILDAIASAGGNIEHSASQFPDVEFRRRKGTLMVDMALIKECFEQSLSQITEHIRRIMATVGGVHCILAVGGYAESDVLMARLEADFKTSECNVVRPPSASEAVVCGAVMFGQNPEMMESRRAKLTYGVKAVEPFQLGRHNPEKMALSPLGILTLDAFCSFVKANERVPIGHVVEKEFCPTHPNQTHFHVELYSSPETNTLYVDEDGCRKLGLIEIVSEDVSKGFNRIIVATINFYTTTLRFSAVERDKTSGEVKKLKCSFECF